MGVRVGLPSPNEYWGAHTSLALPSPEEISVYLARFVVAAEKIELTIQSQNERYRVLGEVKISVDPGEPIEISWLTPAPKTLVRFILKTTDGEFVED